jgi:hypothetical protein
MAKAAMTPGKMGLILFITFDYCKRLYSRSNYQEEYAATVLDGWNDRAVG